MKHVIVLGDSFNNTLGLIRSLGEAGAVVHLILVGEDRLFVSRSKYVSSVCQVASIDEIEPNLRNLATLYKGACIVCSNDKAALFVDKNEEWLSDSYTTPMNGRHIGRLFDKDAQCALAEKCGFNVPRSIIYSREDALPDLLTYPILLKPDNSLAGSKSDIHICYDLSQLNASLAEDSNCNRYLIQEFIEKDYEINMIGMATGDNVFLPGGIKKIRHYPTINSPCSYGMFVPSDELGVDLTPIKRYMKMVGYRGPFSVELLRRGNIDYFMEFNFRHDGLAYVATAAGVNLFKPFLYSETVESKAKATYMMDISTDYCHVKDGTLSFRHWLADFIKTDCQLNFNWRDSAPTIHYYRHKIMNKVKNLFSSK